MSARRILEACATLMLLAALGGDPFAAAAAEGPVVPSFVEETTSAGIDSLYSGEWEYMVGGGVAVFDCNEDGFADMLLAGGSSQASFYRNASTAGGTLRFTKTPSGLEIDKVTGAYPVDIDSDGHMDVILLRVGENIVMRGTGSCHFERANEKWSFDGGDAWSTALAATWERDAKWPTVAIGNYIDRNEEIAPWGSCTDNWLHRPAVNGKEAFASALALKPSFCALSMLFTDWNRSGTPSLRISNDREYYVGGEEQLWKVEPSQPPAAYLDSDGWKRLRIWGMGIASYDLNFDTYPEYFLTSMADNRLQTLASIPRDGLPSPTFKEEAYPRGVTAQRPYTGGELKPSTAWHAQFEDVNNDGLADLFIAKGNVTAMPDFAMRDPNNLLLQTAGGKFVESGDTAGVASLATSRGAALEDFNLDGIVDLVVVNRGSTAQLWRNTTENGGRWIALQLRQPAPNRDAIGAWLEVRCNGVVIRREITVGGGHASGQAGWRHTGLGDLKEVEMRVIWPDGQPSNWTKIETNRFYVIERDTGTSLWSPG